MAQVDSNIALSIKPAQIESPLTFSARAAELQGAQQTQFMNMLKMKEYADESRIKNNMTKWLSGKPDLDDDRNINYLATQFGTQGLALAKQIDERRKARGEADYRTAQIDDLKSQGLTRGYNLGKTQNEDAIKTISGFTNRQQALDLLYQSEANGTIPRAAAEAIRSTIPDNEEEFEGFKQNLITRLASPDERIRQSNRVEDRAAPKWELKKVGAREMLVDTNPYSKTVGQMKPGVEALVDTTPKPEKIEQNGRISFIDMNPNSPTYGQPTGAMQEIVDTAPKWTARDIGGSITYVDENQNSSTFGQQKEGATLTKTAAPAAVTESSLAKLVREREALPKNSPLLKKYDEAIDKETGGAPPELIKEYLYAQKNNGFKGTFLEWKREMAKATKIVVQPAPGAKPTDTALDMLAYQYIKDSGTITQMPRQLRTAIVNRAAELMGGSAENMAGDITANRQDTAAAKAAVKDFTSGKSAVATRSFNTAIDHLETMEKLATALQNNDTRVFNSIGNFFAKQTGTAAPANFEAAKAIVGGEVAKALTGANMALKDREEIRDAIIASSSPQQLMGVLKTFKQLLGGQLNSLNIQYQTSTGRDDFRNKLSPASKRELDALNPQAPTSNAPRQMSPQDKAALDWANSNANDPRAAAIKKRLGVNK